MTQSRTWFMKLSLNLKKLFWSWMLNRRYQPRCSQSKLPESQKVQWTFLVDACTLSSDRNWSFEQVPDKGPDWSRLYLSSVPQVNVMTSSDSLSSNDNFIGAHLRHTFNQSSWRPPSNGTPHVILEGGSHLDKYAHMHWYNGIVRPTIARFSP